VLALCCLSALPGPCSLAPCDAVASVWNTRVTEHRLCCVLCMCRCSLVFLLRANPPQGHRDAYCRASGGKGGRGEEEPEAKFVPSHGLTSAEAADRLKQYGRNELEEVTFALGVCLLLCNLHPVC
jgi:hypothetical protein